MNDSDHPRLVGTMLGEYGYDAWIRRHPRLDRVIRVMWAMLVCGFGLFIVAAFLFGSPAGKIVQGIVLAAVLATLSWLRGNWLYLFILAVLWRVEGQVNRIIDERERIARERHEQILEALHQVRDELRDELRDERELREHLDELEG